MAYTGREVSNWVTLVCPKGAGCWVQVNSLAPAAWCRHGRMKIEEPDD